MATYKDIYLSNGVISNCTFSSDMDRGVEGY